IRGKSKKEAEEFLKRVDCHGKVSDPEPEVEIILRIPRSELTKLERLREVLSAQGKVPTQEQAILKAVGDCLEKRDPVRKAERAKARQERLRTALSPGKKTESHLTEKSPEPVSPGKTTEPSLERTMERTSDPVSPG